MYLPAFVLPIISPPACNCRSLFPFIIGCHGAGDEELFCAIFVLYVTPSLANNFLITGMINIVYEDVSKYELELLAHNRTPGGHTK